MGKKVYHDFWSLSHKLQICTELKRTTLHPDLCLTNKPIIQYTGKKVYHDFWSVKHQSFPKIIINHPTIDKGVFKNSLWKAKTVQTLPRNKFINYPPVPLKYIYKYKSIYRFAYQVTYRTYL